LDEFDDGEKKINIEGRKEYKCGGEFEKIWNKWRIEREIINILNRIFGLEE
jgi:hypothetical protein